MIDLSWFGVPTSEGESLFKAEPDPTQCPACLYRPLTKFSMPGRDGMRTHHLTCRECAWNGEDKNPPPVPRL